MKYLKEIGNYVLIFIVTVAILTGLLFGVAKIPRKYIEENIKESLPYFEKYKYQIDEQTKRRDYTIINPYADSMILNIIYALDTNNALRSVMEARYYSERGDDDYDNRDLNKMVEEGLESNEEYMRYWHGSIIIIKPLLMFLNLEQMHHLNFYILLIMEIIVLIMLLRRKHFALSIAYVLGLLATSFWIVPRSLEYTWCYMLMNIISILAIKFKEDDKKLNKLFFISGILICYFDFFTAETLTILIPILMVLGIRFKEREEFSLKDNILFVIKSLFIWGIGYSLMWGAKWLLASIVLGESALPHVLGKAKRRVNGDLYNKTRNDMYSGAILRNMYTLYPINIVKRTKDFILPIIAYIAVQLAIIDYKNKKKINFLLTMLLIGIIPYIRYLVLANHSYLHCFFTFRAQFATVMALTLILIHTTSKEKLFYNFGKNKKETKNNLQEKIEDNKKENIIDMDLTILMPVLNEEETIESCINKAKKYLEENKINGEILISDNGSTDSSVKKAENLGARVILTKEKGYGNALINGINQAKGKYIIMADADDSYDLENLDSFYKNLEKGYDFVIGNRFEGGIEKGGMKLSHKIGVRFLSLVGRIVCKCKVYDFHCGIRGLNTKKFQELNLTEPGMEFASEMIVKAAKANFNILEIPTTLSKDGRKKGRSHLNTIKDGFRHLNYLIKSI